MNTQHGHGSPQGQDGNALIFGKYEIIRRLALGGMGEVFLARQTGVAVDRLVILKSLLPELAEQDGFVEQFLDEARVAATLNHPNIVSIYEVGLWNGQYFIAMEFIHGGDLSRLQKMAAKKRVSCPYQVSARMIHDAALGLDHAHHATSMDGAPLNIVHRDISPQNIMVRGDGVTKVVDFGIAKAANRATRTATGMLKGKLQYMPPEQVAGGNIDARADQFALGVVLWELTTNKRLFKGENEIQTIQRILKEEIPRPSTVVPGFPPDLEAVIMRMLMRNPEQRYARCADVSRDLQGYLDACSRTVGPAQVTEFVKLVLGEQLTEVTSNLQPSKQNFLISLEQSKQSQALDHGTPTTATSAIEPGRKSVLKGVMAAAALTAVLFGAAAMLLFGGGETDAIATVDPPPAPVAAPSEPKKTASAKATTRRKIKTKVKSFRTVSGRGAKRQIVNMLRITDPAGAKIFVDGKLWPDRVPTVLKGLSPGEHKLEFELENGDRVEAEAPVRVAAPVAKARAQVPSAPVVSGRTITLKNGPKKGRVLLDGKKVCTSFPCRIKKAPPGRRNITVFDGELEYYFEAVVKQMTRLLVESTPVGATVQVAGKVVGKTPFDLVKAMAPGVPVEVRLVKRGYVTFEEEISIARGSDTVKKVTLEKKMAAAPPPPPPKATEPEKKPVAKEPGLFSVVTTPWAQVTIDGKRRGSTPLMKIKLSAGKHKVKLVNESEGINVTKTITIEPGATLKKKWSLE